MGRYLEFWRGKNVAKNKFNISPGMSGMTVDFAWLAGYWHKNYPVETFNAPWRYSLGVTPSHFLNVLRKTLGSEKPNR